MDPELLELKFRLARQLRPILEQRDGNQCRACQQPGDLQIAHITSARAFCYRLGWTPQAIQESYRLDNIVLLCKPCHGAQTLGPLRILRTDATLRNQNATPYHRACADNRLYRWGLENAADAATRQDVVTSLFRRLQQERGWLGAIDIARGHGWDGRPVPPAEASGVRP